MEYLRSTTIQKSITIIVLFAIMQYKFIAKHVKRRLAARESNTCKKMLPIFVTIFGYNCLLCQTKFSERASNGKTSIS